MENKIPTAEEFFKEKYGSNDRIAIDNAILLTKEFAKLHVEMALKEASENAELKYRINDISCNDKILDKKSILNAYPLTNIK